MRRWGALLGALLLSGALAAGGACTQTPERRIGRALGAGAAQATDGFWYVYDRHDECDDPYSDAALFGRYSINVTAAVYDRAAHTLYYFELDT